MYTVTIDAETAAELRHKLINLTSVMLGEGSFEKNIENLPKSPPESAKPVSAADLYPDQALADLPAKSKRGRPPRPPVAETEAVEMPPVDAEKDNAEPEVEEPALNDTIADEKVKAEVIRTLQSIYNSGKVQVIRHVLAKYGEGAKSFPEIEASRFPAIREALARGEIA